MCSLLSAESRPFRVGEARANDAAAVRSEISACKPCWVLACLGRTHGVHDGTVYSTIDFLEQKGRLKDNLRDNLEAPVTLAAVCHGLGVQCVQIATGCIYLAADLEQIGSSPPFREEDDANFTGSAYSTVKGATDRLLRLFASTTLFFRIRMPITHDRSSRSFLTKILNYAKICSVPNSMSVLDGPEGLLSLFLRMADAGYVGCYNATNPGVMSHNEILSQYRAICDSTFRWENFTVTEQAEVLDSARSNCELDSARLEEAAKALNFPLPTLSSAITKVLMALKDMETPAAL